MHTPRIAYADYRQIAPAIVGSLLALGQAADTSGLDKPLIELVKLRVSQLNGCAFCLQHHLTVARQLGIPQAKLDLLAGWHDAGIFSAREQAALRFAEILTRVAERGVPDADYQALRETFNETEIAFLTAAIGTINMWNRLAIGLSFSPTLPQAASGQAA